MVWCCDRIFYPKRSWGSNSLTYYSMLLFSTWLESSVLSSDAETNTYIPFISVSIAVMVNSQITLINIEQHILEVGWMDFTFSVLKIVIAVGWGGGASDLLSYMVWSQYYGFTFGKPLANVKHNIFSHECMKIGQKCLFYCNLSINLIRHPPHQYFTVITKTSPNSTLPLTKTTLQLLNRTDWPADIITVLIRSLW